MRYHDFFVERIRKGERVLDLGCGYAAVAASIAERAGAEVTGMDWSDGNLAQARELADARGLAARIRLVKGDITKERAEGRFDVVVMSNVLEHLAGREALLTTYREWYGPRALLVRVPAIDRDWQTAWKRELGVDYRCDDTHETEYTEAQLRQELASAGWRVTELIARWGEYWAVAE
jgi:2-polyprenyl-3-methyl-5-hydroxy-6-metoxy-1,4-benzoquinol methylase